MQLEISGYSLRSAAGSVAKKISRSTLALLLLCSLVCSCSNPQVQRYCSSELTTVPGDFFHLDSERIIIQMRSRDTIRDADVYDWMNSDSAIQLLSCYSAQVEKNGMKWSFSIPVSKSDTNGPKLKAALVATGLFEVP